MSAPVPGDWQRDVFQELGGVAAEAVPPGPEPPAVPAPPAADRPVAAAAPPLPAPVSVPVVTPAVRRAGQRARHGDPLGRRAVRALRDGLSSTARDTEEATRLARSVQQPITTGRQIAVTSIRGGAGKSTVAALLGLTFAHYRADPVLAIEADPALGTLPRLLGASEVRWTFHDLARILDPSMRVTDVTGYLLPYAGGGWLLPGSQGAVGAQLDIDSYRIVMTSLRRWFGTTVVDCETLPAEVARTALTTTQARVLVAPATAAGVATTRTVLDWIGGLHRSMLPTTVVALAHTSPGMGVDARRAAEYLGVGGAAVVPLPYDRALAEGGQVRTELLGRATRQAALGLAAEVMDRAMSRGRGGARGGGTAAGVGG
ncbi:hypothetical protein H7827_14375 [Streptomyces sp. JH002]|uniref:hypothetical protein n=1 Tax=Streptomyces sp. JH002 TaxID=2763259 RepID=UPI003D8092FB